MMHHPTETRRYTPLVAIGPGEQYMDRLYIHGRQLVRPPDPTPPAPRMLKPSTGPRLVTRPRWSWSRMGLGILMAFAITLLAALLIVAIAIALVITPVVVGSRKL